MNHKMIKKSKLNVKNYVVFVFNIDEYIKYLFKQTSFLQKHFIYAFGFHNSCYDSYDC